MNRYKEGIAKLNIVVFVLIYSSIFTNFEAQIFKLAL
jgi:hypothetical protein